MAFLFRLECLVISLFKGPGKIYWRHGAGAKAMTRTLFFIALKHAADTFFAVSGNRADFFPQP